ncbi:MAG: hypothetical protein ABS92_03680 [Thiobacillus sp. SCN 63-374]|nr:MAG: hypothetical protein ABS92_03680 [Thiobacillus sp. SCN 63-374]
MEWFFLTLRYVFTAIPFVFAALFALVGFWMVIATASRVTAGAWVVGMAFLIETAFVSAPFIPVGIQLTSNDLAFALLAAALVMRVLFFEFPHRRVVYGIWLAFGGVLLASLAVGLVEFGSTAGVEARPNFYFWMAGLYFASFTYSPDVLKKLWRIAQWTAWLVVLVAVYRWVGLKYGFVSEGLVKWAGASSEFRVVGSNPTFFLAVVGAAYFAMWLRDSKMTALVVAIFMLGMVVVLQHRSVWVAAIGAFAIVAWHERSAVSAKAFPILGMGLVLAGLMAGLIAFNPTNRVTETIATSATSVTASEGTHMDRLLGWQVLLRDFSHAGPKEWVLGNPYGTGYERWVQGHFKDYSPHNFYIQLLLRVGTVGLLMFLWVHYYLRRGVRESLQANSADTTLSSVLLAILVANLLYFIPYQGFYLQGAFYGVLIGYLAANARTVSVFSGMTPGYKLAESK